jgi:putative phage-type endonuclease
MTRVSIIPESEEQWHKLRAQDVTSTESPALFGLSPYMTKFELWHRKKSGEVYSIKDNERMFWGRRLEQAIAEGIAEQQGWSCEPRKQYERLDGVRMGASFDYAAWKAAPNNEPNGETGMLEIKNVDYLAFRDNWTVGEDGEIEAPPHIEIQLQHQLHVSGYTWGAIGVLVGGNKPHVLIREYDPKVGKGIENKIREFWLSIEAGREPEPFYPDDSKFVQSLYGYAEPGKILDARDDDEIATLCHDYAEASKREKLAKEDKEIAKAKLLEVIGNAEKVLSSGHTISCGIVGPTLIEAYERKGFRNFRITTRKEKA